MPFIGLTIGILLLIWRSICLHNWLTYPQETLRQTIGQWKSLHKVFFFVPFLVPYKYYERNPERAIRSYITGEVVMIILLIIVCILAITSMIGGT